MYENVTLLEGVRKFRLQVKAESKKNIGPLMRNATFHSMHPFGSYKIKRVEEEVKTRPWTQGAQCWGPDFSIVPGPVGLTWTRINFGRAFITPK